MREDRHVLARIVRLDHHLYGHALVAEVTTRFHLCVAVAAKLQRRRLLDGGLVGLAHHLEVGGGLQVVVFYVLREVEHDVVACPYDAALRLWCAEELRTARVFHTAQHLRLAGQEGITVSAEQHSPEVVTLLHHRTFAEEACHDVAVLRNHRLRAGSGAVDSRVGIVATEVRPVVVATGRLLILELDVVEIVLVLIEAADDHRQIPALAAFGGSVAVHDPLVARRRDGYRASRLQEVYIKGHLRINVQVALRDESYLQALVVEVLTGIYLKGLLRHLSRTHLDAAHVAGERHTVNHQLRTLRIRFLHQVEVEKGVGGLWLLALVGQEELEAGWFAVRHSAQALLVHRDLGVLYLLRALIHHCSRIIEQCGALTLPRTAGSTATGAIDEAARRSIVLQFQVSFQILLVVLCLFEEVVVIEYIHDTQISHTCLLTGRCHVIHVEVQMALLVHANGKALLASVCLRFGILGGYTKTHRRYQTETESGAQSLYFHLHVTAFVFARSGGSLRSTSFGLQYAAQQFGCRGSQHG